MHSGTMRWDDYRGSREYSVEYTPYTTNLSFFFFYFLYVISTNPDDVILRDKIELYFGNDIISYDAAVTRVLLVSTSSR